MATVIRTIVLPSAALASQTWWTELHSTINLSYKVKSTQVFPPTWTRLHFDPAIGAQRLAQELGPNGYLSVVLVDEHPVACGGVVPFRGHNWINDELPPDDFTDKFRVQPLDSASSAMLPASTDPIEDWEICCFCVHPDHRHRKLGNQMLAAIIDFVRPLGGKRLMSNYAIEETGGYWPKMGFKTIPGAGGMLKQGFTHTVGMEGLRADIHFAMGVKDI